MREGVDKTVRDKNDDPDFRMLSCYLKSHYAPQIFHSALEKLIARAGLYIPYEPPIEEPRLKPRKPPQECFDVDYDGHVPDMPQTRREPIKEYYDGNLGVMVKVYNPAYARMK